MENEASPYLTPKSDVHNSDQEYEIISAGKWLRFFNLLVDYIAFTILGAAIGFTVAILFGERGIEFLKTLPEMVLGAAILLLYYVIFEGLLGRTLGKLITGTKVVNESGNKASFLQIVGRSFARFIPFEAFSFLFGKGRGWHDSLSKTYVTKC